VTELPPPDERVVRIVRGYLVGDLPYPRARRIGRESRTAVVVPSYTRDSVDAEFDTETYQLLVDAAVTTVGASELLIFDGSRESRCGVREFRDRLLHLPECDAFPRVVFARSRDLLAVMVYEPWVNVGGREPYRDSHTFVFLASDAHANAWAETAREIVVRRGYSVSEVHGADRPHPRRFFSRLLDLLASR